VRASDGVDDECDTNLGGILPADIIARWEHRRSARIIVVDDDFHFRMLLDDILVAEGVEILQADSGTPLVDLVRRHHPDLILLDTPIEPVAGFDAIESLRANGQNIPVIVLTTVHDVAMLEAAVDAGADDYLTKPISEAVLLALWQLSLLRTVDRRLFDSILVQLPDEERWHLDQLLERFHRASGFL
jgi:DNA-binding response OmpR family regulator